MAGSVTVDGDNLLTTLPSLVLNESAPRDKPTLLNKLFVARVKKLLKERVMSAVLGVPVAYSSPFTPPSPPVLPRSGSSTAAAVMRVQYPLSSKEKDYQSAQEEMR